MSLADKSFENHRHMCPFVFKIFNLRDSKRDSNIKETNRQHLFLDLTCGVLQKKIICIIIVVIVLLILIGGLIFYFVNKFGGSTSSNNNNGGGNNKAQHSD